MKKKKEFIGYDNSDHEDTVKKIYWDLHLDSFLYLFIQFNLAQGHNYGASKLVSLVMGCRVSNHFLLSLA